MQDLTAADFTEGETLEAIFPDGRLALALEKVEPISHAHREGGGFRLELVGPAELLLPQGTYSIAAASGTHDIFIVPIARDRSGTRYEAIFN